MDQRYFTSKSFLTATLPASGMNAKLTYDSDTDLYWYKDVLVIIVAALAFAIALASMVTERMIGVELIQTVQLVYFTMTIM